MRLPSFLTRRGVLMALAIISALWVYAYVDAVRERGALRSRVAALEAEIARMNDTCETRLAKARAAAGWAGECDQKADGRTLAEFVAGLPPEFVQKMTEDFFSHVPEGALCGLQPPPAVAGKTSGAPASRKHARPTQSAPK